MTTLKNRPRDLMGICLIALVLLATLLSGCGKTATPPAAQPTPVRVQHASKGPAVPPIDTNGIVVTKHEMRLSFKMGGVVRRIYVQEGDVVKKGQRLAEIELTEVGAQVEQVRQMADKAERDLKRGENLYADQVISLEQLQDLRTQAAMAGAQYKSAQFNLGYSVISAPRDGMVMRKLVEEREVVPAGAPVLLLGESDRGYVVRAALADREIVNVKLGDKGEIRMDAFPGQSMSGTIVEIASAADERSGMFPIEVHFDAPPPRLVSGLVARLRLAPTSEAPPLTYVPIAALVEGDGNRASVFVIDGGKAQRRDVRVAFITADSIALESGLASGEAVVTDGALFLENGEPVEILRDTTRQAVNTPPPATES
ncbi:MAG TPA: efflux RND transporter periplasmic adaptor subunit [Steroidobacteraceae bacterium]|jgi:RND family efflux transporter MFP subunit|nr:efflux RND transporter periplasmic adaptor subunit [Steroidobacteraceae bacterium]